MFFLHLHPILDSVNGTVSCMAPELLTGRYQHNSKTDIYALAMTLFEIAFGVTPFLRMSNSSIMALVTSGSRPTLDITDYNGDAQPELLPGTAPSPEITALIRDCWDGERDRRPSIDTIVDRLEAMPSDEVAEVAARNFMLHVLGREPSAQLQQQQPRVPPHVPPRPAMKPAPKPNPIAAPSDSSHGSQTSEECSTALRNTQDAGFASQVVSAPSLAANNLVLPSPALSLVASTESPSSASSCLSASRAESSSSGDSAASTTALRDHLLQQQLDLVLIPLRAPAPSDQAEELYATGLELVRKSPQGYELLRGIDTLAQAANMGHQDAIR